MEKYDFSGWATKANLKCSDGRIIRKDAFKHCDGQTVPLVWGHQHNEPFNVLGHALLENREEGVYTYCKFNETEQGINAKQLVQHGDVVALSIYANQLKQNGSDVLHGAIREVSLVLAGANPGAFIDSVICHGEESGEEGIIYTGEDIILSHSDKEKTAEEETKPEEEVAEEETKSEDEKTVEDEIQHSDSNDDANKKDEEKSEDSEDDKKDSDGETVLDVFETLSEKQKNAVYYMMALVDENSKKETQINEGEEKDMKHNVFENDKETKTNTLSHSDQVGIVELAKKNNVGSLRTAMAIYAEENELKHADFVDAEGNDSIDTLFPEFKDVKPGAPEFIQRDQGWVDVVMKKVHKSPFSRIRTRQADIRSNDLRALGYAKGAKKELGKAITLLSRTTDPQTIYRKDMLNRDDIIDITDFDVVEYQYKVMRQNLNEEIAMAIMIGDGREDGDAAKISEAHVRSILNDDELYVIHAEVDLKKAKEELQGGNTSLNFGENYIYAEGIIQAALYSREKYKGVGTPDFYCTPHLLNVMLLARDLNGRRIYNSVTDLAAALNVNAIYTAEQFEGKTRTTKDGKVKNLLGIFVNLAGNYHVGSTKGGEITKFQQFDIDFNQEKYLIETRLSGALVNPFSAIVLEEPAAEEEAGE